jgi:hypothetical protein
MAFCAADARADPNITGIQTPQKMRWSHLFGITVPPYTLLARKGKICSWRK